MQVQKRITRILIQAIVGLMLAVDHISSLSAICNVGVNPNIDSSLRDQVTGTVILTQESGGNTSIQISLSGFDKEDANTNHGFHIHQLTDTTQGCNSMGGHFNPTGQNHGAPTAAIRHYGDLGNVVEDAQGKVSKTLTDHLVTLSGNNTVIGRSIVVHEKADDLGLVDNAGSRSTGNAGKRLACCIIVTNSSIKPSPTIASIFIAVCLSTILRFL